MFRKAFKVKANHHLKMTDKEKLKNDFIAMYQPNDELLHEMFSKKETLLCLKIETSAQEIIHVYVWKKKPVLFTHNGVVLPTVYLLWEYPSLRMCQFTVTNDVVHFLTGGANLMAPGVTYPSFNSTSYKYYEFLENMVAFVNTTHNKAAIAVGVTAQTSRSLIGQKGKAVTIFHVWGDKLCGLDTTGTTLPKMGLPKWVFEDDDDDDNDDDDDVDTCAEASTSTSKLAEEVVKQCDEKKNNTNSKTIKKRKNQKSKKPVEGATALLPDSDDSDDEVDRVKEMDDLMMRCFLTTAKYSKNFQLPILASTFYKLHMIPTCPPDKRLDVKKSSYKKVSNFLELLRQMGLLHVEKLKKGVDHIVHIDYDNVMIHDFKLELEDRPRAAETTESDFSAPLFVEAVSVTAKVLPLFSQAGYKKGDIIDIADVRTVVIDYVKNKNLQSEDKGYVNLDDLLKSICGGGNRTLKWNDAVQKVRSQMTNCYKLTGTDGEVQITKKKLQPISISVVKRACNKKVTLVDNLANFGIDLDELCSHCQKGVAASTTVVRSSTPKKADQLLIQGNQVLFIYQELTEKYKIPKKYIMGLEYAPRQKKQQ